MNNKASIHEITIACFSITLLLILLAWRNNSLFLGTLALISLSGNLFIEAYKERKKGNRFFFSQYLLRGFALWAILILVFFII
ncbi:hypothetical protein [Gracilibacillus kekensis]|uniref:Uncharacterized protein n=1 Tax=Gracilibacillus kekensis TaxID=1027249 RepID=A0A1M7KG53_9BACI|nr:hypothetical protein [Gracilibacillus kekensis]SHM63824.1 hypothetical protein SAMN05216179_0677 [Gracilibacillus kekensis]